MEIGLHSLRVIGQGSLSAKEYHELMMGKIDDVHKSRSKALEEIEKEKIKIAKAYNKCVVEKSFQVRDIVWKMILPLGTQSGKFGKWSPSWEDRLELSGLCRVMLTSWRTLKDTHYQKL
jgi:hypothetical protein